MKPRASAEANLKWGDMYRPYDYDYDRDTNAVLTNPTTEPHSLPWPRAWSDPANGSTKGCTWADDDLWEEDIVERTHVSADEEEDEEEVFVAEEVCLFPSVWGEWTRGPGEVCLFPSVWSQWTRTQPRKHRSGVRGRGGRRTTTKKNKKRRCPRHTRERRRRRAVRRKQLARRARTGGRRRRPAASFRGGGDSGDEGDQVRFVLVS